MRSCSLPASSTTISWVATSPTPWAEPRRSRRGAVGRGGPSELHNLTHIRHEAGTRGTHLAVYVASYEDNDHNPMGQGRAGRTGQRCPAGGRAAICDRGRVARD